MKAYFIDFSKIEGSAAQYLVAVAIICCAFRLGYNTPPVATVKKDEIYTGCFICPKYGVFLVNEDEQPDSYYEKISAEDFCQLTVDAVMED
jgi:hypothetical protein